MSCKFALLHDKHQRSHVGGRIMPSFALLSPNCSSRRMKRNSQYATLSWQLIQYRKSGVGGCWALND